MLASYAVLTCALLNDEVAILSGVLCTVFTVMFAEVRTPLLAAAAAVTTAVPALIGAAKSPCGETDPALEDQITAVWGVF